MIYKPNLQKKPVPVAQLDRVLASDAKGCEFEPRRVHQKKRPASKLAGLFFNSYANDQGHQRLLPKF